MNTDKKRILTGESREDVGASERQSVRASFLCCLCCLGCLLFKSATAWADTASYASADGASYTSAKVYSFCPTAPNVFASATHVWHMEEASGNSRADSVGSSTLDEIGGAVSRGTGIHGNCADINSSHVLDNVSDVGDSVFTVAFWIKARSVPLAALFEVQMASFSCDTGPYFSFSPTGTILFNDESGGNDDPPIQSSAISTNAWHLIIGTSDGTIYKLYVDGSLIDSVSGSGSYTLGAPVVGDLNSCTGNATSLDALLDELVIWPTALVQSDVDYIWNSGAGNFAP